MKNISDLKIALVHDFLDTLGGAERVLLALHELFPSAPIYTLSYSEQDTHGLFRECDIRPSKLSNTLIGRSRTLSLPFLPNAVESFRLDQYDIVISSSSAFAKGVITRPRTLHICYCHTPMRYVWDWTHEYARENSYDTGVRSVFGRLITHYLRLWDQASAKRVDVWLANSQNVKGRIKKYYRAPSEVVYPPVPASWQGRQAEGDVSIEEPYFLIVSRLSAYKKIDLAIEACARFRHRLVIIGEGKEHNRLERLARELEAPVTFLGYQDDKVADQYYTHARAFLFPGEDDFGITPVEAMAHGTPVIAYAKGGALETVALGKTGLFFSQPTAESLLTALEHFSKVESKFKVADMKQQAKRFSPAVFKQHILKVVRKEWEKREDEDC